MTLRKYSLPRILVITASALFFVLSANAQEFAQDGASPVQLGSSDALPNFYGHIFGGGGFSYLAAGDIKSIVGDEYGVGLGLPTWSYGARAGFRHIFQVEYNLGKAQHDFRFNSIVKDIPSKVIHMKYDTNDVQFKINPIFWKTTTDANGLTKAFFWCTGSATSNGAIRQRMGSPVKAPFMASSSPVFRNTCHSVSALSDTISNLTKRYFSISRLITRRTQAIISSKSSWD